MTPRLWAGIGACLGALAGGVAFAPASWLARAVADASDGQLLLADARGTVWSGSARPVLSGGADSRDAATLPGRLAWTLRLRGAGIELQALQDCCLGEPLRLQLRPGLNRIGITLAPLTGPVGRWPLSWLAGLGTPWNTMQLSGRVRLSSPGMSLQSVQGRWRLDGQAELELQDVASRLSQLAPLGSYRVSLRGGDTATLSLVTLDGPLQISVQGEWAASGLRLRGEAHAAPGAETALDNLLNIIGRRSGARSVLSIG